MADAPAIAVTLKNTLRYFPDFSYDIPGWNEAGAQWQTALLAEFTNGSREGARAVVATCSAKSAELYIAALWPGQDLRIESEAAPSREGDQAYRLPRSGRDQGTQEARLGGLTPRCRLRPVA